MDSCDNPPASGNDTDNDNGNKDAEEIDEEDSHSEHQTRATKGRGTKRKFKVKKTKKVKVQWAKAWDHFTRLKDDPDRCTCHYCGREYTCPTSSGTSNLNKHLKACKMFLACTQPQDQSKLDHNADGTLKFGIVSEELFKEACYELIVLAELPLSFIESLAWRYFCKKVMLYAPPSRRTATRQIVKMYVEKKEEMRNLIGKQRVSLTTDIWTAQATAASYMVVTAHWIDAQWRLKKLIIGFKNVADHRGKTIAEVLIGCLADWRIKKVFTITVDNATANTLALGMFKEDFKEIGYDSLVLGGEFLHLRCAAHIINLVVRDGLKDLDSSVEAIRNGITYVRSSTERLNSFDLRVDNVKVSRGSLPLDVKTRWNSTYLMLIKAQKFRLAFDKMEAEDKVYNSWFDEPVNGDKRVGPPTKADWEAVEWLVEFLRIFYVSTLVVSASESVNSYKCYSEIVTIETSLTLLSTDPDIVLREKAYVMKAKFDKYWDGLKEINKLLIVASILDPTSKMSFATMCFSELYGKDTWEAKDMELAVIEVMNRLFEEYNAIFKKPSIDLIGGQNQSQSTQSTVTASHSGGSDIPDLEEERGKYERISLAYKRMVKQKGIQQSSNELELYLKESVENPNVVLGEYDVLSWWRLNAPKYPVLSELAKDVFAMQVSSVASESAFSTSGRVLSPSRSCLTHYTLEVLMCTSQWLKSSLNLKERIGDRTTQQILDEIVQQDQLEKEFNNSSIGNN